ncbi:MAG TPA: 2-succinyl-6-hydroxy-2,4-cyclohexadiene-1-carboxylate synthase [Ktedonobacterales bacterium]
MPSTRMAVNGIHLNAESREPAMHSAEQRTLVLLHGFTGSASGWGAHLDRFADAGFRVIALDMLGHGESDAPSDPHRYRIEHCRDDIIAALAELGVQHGSAILLGYSMGGRIALYTALSGYFRALILESASPGLASAGERERRRASDEALAASIERDSIAAFVERWENLPLFASQRALPKAIRASLHEQRLHNRPDGLANSLRGVGTGAQPPLYERLPELAIPVLLITGELDAKYWATARDMAVSMSHAEVRIVAGAGHTVHLERPDQFDALVVEFCISQYEESWA